ncbi:unnamed protein product [Bursaphelenchus xylophilus]|uniref:(pine wood nematode) hypothetical protein n=1 Tax=Bursaphelenchus xylophilus TaxID=6326 RepID=A0A1I7RPR4_BURXY|nr:unnamed protein product [Bursaphelenchus xylophilus]CAG9096484.1 unnamed protein product [Bursaphelenchus xylophilus]
MENLKHLLILCCYGGVPFIDYGPGTNETDGKLDMSNMLDPTDWIAVDSSGSLLNASIHPELLAENPGLATLIPLNADIQLDSCDLYNLTFSSNADQKLFDVGHGTLKCRCPRKHFGSACHLNAPISLKLTMNSTIAAIHNTTNGNPFAVVMLMLMCLMAAMAAVFMMMRACFCDCFGGFKSPFSSRESQDLDPEAVNRCLQMARAHEEQDKRNYGESRHPLIPSISEGCAPYNPPVLSVGQFEVVPPPPRHCSPPPSYRSSTNSLDQIPSHKL